MFVGLLYLDFVKKTGSVIRLGSALDTLSAKDYVVNGRL